MNIRILISAIFALFLSVTSLHAQEPNVEVKKKIVSIDGQDLFRMERERMGNDILLFDLKTDAIVLKLLAMDHGTLQNPQDDFRRMVFVESGKMLETRRMQGYPMENILQRMVKRGVLDSNGKFIPEKVDGFILEYDEKITERTVEIR